MLKKPPVLRVHLDKKVNDEENFQVRKIRDKNKFKAGRKFIAKKKNVTVHEIKNLNKKDILKI